MCSGSSLSKSLLAFAVVASLVLLWYKWPKDIVDFKTRTESSSDHIKVYVFQFGSVYKYKESVSVSNTFYSSRFFINEDILEIDDFRSRFKSAWFKRLKHSDASSGEKDCSMIVSDKWNDQGLENQINTSGDESSGSRNECNDKSTSGDDTNIRPSYDTEPMVEVESVDLRDALSVIFGLLELKLIPLLPILLFTLRHDLGVFHLRILTRRLQRHFVGRAGARQPGSPEYIPDPMELEDHVTVYFSEPEASRGLVAS
ncbi:hypothetical protein Tco_0988478 [Tanacetum coccineum]|uniref:Uncharacterized protein n=1 Tax=Tanacetum coccineum TaxID=301880 RepID=A0ABQ5ERE7_9ASTR